MKNKKKSPRYKLKKLQLGYLSYFIVLNNEKYENVHVCQLKK